MSEFSKEIQISIEVAAELFTNLIFKTYQGVAGFVKDKNKEHDFFGVATKKYVGGLIGRYNTVQILGMSDPVPLKDLFVRANILKKITARIGLRPEDLAAFFDFDRRSFGKKHETVDGEIIVNKLHKFIVLGKPGAGKTTYLKYLTLMMLDNYSQIERRRLPIFVTLRAWADESVPLMDFIAQEFDTCGFEEAKHFVERMLKDGECLVLFDGLDEVSETAKQDDIIRQIKNFADKYAENQFIVSCRVAAYNHWFEGFTEVEMADFNERQMETFIRNWFRNEPEVANECWQRLQISPPLRELASVPLLLTLLCLEYSDSNDFPPNRAELYHRAIETLLTKWDSTRRIRRPEVYRKLTTRQKESMFTRIAISTFIENKYFIPERDLTRMVEKFIEHLPSFEEEELEMNSKVILKAIEAQHGIFVERANGVYSFAHLTFQEYFTAKYIVDNAREGTLEKLVEQHLYDAKWKEVFLLTTGLLDNADELLLLMRQKADQNLEVPGINALMEVIKKSLLPMDIKCPDVFRRNFVVSVALDLARARAHALELDLKFEIELEPELDLDIEHELDRVSALALELDLAFDLAVDLARNLAPNLAFAQTFDLAVDRDLALELDLTVDHTLALDLARARARALGIDLAVDLTVLEAYGKTSKLDEQSILKKIKNYFQANILIIKCLKPANFVSKDVREKMLHEICLPKRG